MGFLRLVFAISVVLSHSYFLKFDVPVKLVVEAFFIMSGFYMALVLDTNPAYQNREKFYLARLVKLYPAYIITFLITLGLIFLTKKGLILLLEDGSTVEIFYGWNQLAEEFKDKKTLIIWLANNLSLRSFPGPEWLTQIIPQGWSIGFEIVYYLLAPSLVKLNKKYLTAIITASLFGKFFITDNSSIFVELGVFCMGIMAYKLYRNFIPQKLNPLPALISVCLIIYMIFCANNTGSFYQITTLLICSISYPFIFSATKNLQIDRKIGNLSYEIYVGHFLVIWVLVNFFNISGNNIFYFAAVGSIIYALALHAFISSIKRMITFSQLQNSTSSLL